MDVTPHHRCLPPWKFKGQTQLPAQGRNASMLLAAEIFTLPHCWPAYAQVNELNFTA
jgi:hypothetical protein